MPRKNEKKSIITRKQKIAAARLNSTQGHSSSLNKVEYLESPRKGCTDNNLYRTVKLGNGLVALLISQVDILMKSGCLDESNLSGAQDLSHSFARALYLLVEWEDLFKNKPRVSSILGEFSDCTGSSYKSPDCTSPEKVIRENEFRSEAYCRLCINVGTFSENPRVTGESLIASMVVLEGCKKYPQINDFKDYPRNNGGFHGSSDGCDITTWFLHAPEKFLPGAIERLAQCFVSPLMKKSAIMQKRKNLELKYREKWALSNRSNGKEQLYSTFAPCYHPSLMFGEYYLETMCQTPDEKFYKEVIKFRERHYSANRMTVVIEAALPLDTLEDYAVKYFSKIPNNGLPPEDLSRFHFADCFNMEEFRRMYIMKPPECRTFCVKALELTWTMPPCQRYYRSKPEKYIAWVINNQSKGSLYRYLSKKKWCFEVESGVGDEDFENNSIWSLFTLTLTLTDEGYKHMKEVLDITYSYLKMLRNEDPNKRIWDEICNIDTGKFRYVDNIRSSNFYQDLGENMHLYPPVDFLTGSVISFEYDPVAIKTWIRLMTPDRANLILYDNDFNETEYVTEDPFDEEEPIYFEKETPMSKEVPDEWFNDWNNIEPFAEFALPEKNPFINDDYTTIPYPDVPTHCLVKIHSNSLSEIWYKQELKRRLPKGHINFCLVTPLPLSSPENDAMLDIFKTILSHFFIDALYPAILAGLKYKIDTCTKGLEVRVSGWSKKLPLLMQTIIKYITECSNLVTERLFVLAKIKRLRTYHETFCNSKKLAKDVRETIVDLANWTAVDKHAALLNLQFHNFQHFLQHFTDHIYILCLVQGDITESMAIQNTIRCIEILNCKPLLPNTMPQLRINEIQRETRCCRIQSFGTNRQICVTNYYQFSDSSFQCALMIDSLLMLMDEPLFEKFINNEKLKDNRCRMSTDHFGSIGYSITVDVACSNLCLHAEQAVWCDEQIESYRKNLSEFLQDLTEKEWLDVKRLLLSVKSNKYANLREEVSDNWVEIISGEFVFDRRAQERDEIKGLGIEDLRKWMVNLMSNGPELRKLSVQVISNSKIEQSSTIETNEPGNENDDSSPNDMCPYQLRYLIDSSSLNEETTSDYYITNIGQYKRELESLPVTIEDDVHGITEGVQNIWLKNSKFVKKES